MNDYQKQLEEFRLHYFTRYNLKLDDEILYFFIRVNELQVDLKKDIGSIPRLQYRRNSDYFLHGMGRVSMSVLLIAPIILFLASLALHFVHTRAPIEKSIIVKNGLPFLELVEDDSTYYVPLKQSHQ